MPKRFLTTTALACLLASAAFAQSPAPTTPSQPPSATPSTPKGDKLDQAPAEKMAPSMPDKKAAADTATPTNFVQQQSPDQWLASKFKGTDVMGQQNKKIGDVSDILFDQKGQIQAYVISVGGFLGVGAKSVALPPTAFQVVPGKNVNDPSDIKLQISMTEEQLKNAPDFKPYEPPRPTTSSLNPGASPAGTIPPMGTKK